MGSNVNFLILSLRWHRFAVLFVGLPPALRTFGITISNGPATAAPFERSARVEAGAAREHDDSVLVQVWRELMRQLLRIRLRTTAQRLHELLQPVVNRLLLRDRPLPPLRKHRVPLLRRPLKLALDDLPHAFRVVPTPLAIQTFPNTLENLELIQRSSVLAQVGLDLGPASVKTRTRFLYVIPRRARPSGGETET